MSLHADESKHISFSLSQIERLCQVAKALSSPLRVKMIGLLASRSMNVNELAEALSMPVSTAALNVRQLEEAGLISTEIQPGIRGAMKLCSRRIDSVSLHLVPETQDGVSALTLKLPLGSYARARGSAKATRRARSTTRIVSPRSSCGLNPARSNTVSRWAKSTPSRWSGWKFRWRFPPTRRCTARISRAIFTSASARGSWACGQAPAITARGAAASTWRIDSLGCTLDGEPLSSVTVADLQLDALEYIPLRIGIHADAAHVGGINLFGEKFGDFAQGIVVRVGYAKAD